MNNRIYTEKIATSLSLSLALFLIFSAPTGLYSQISAGTYKIQSERTDNYLWLNAASEVVPGATVENAEIFEVNSVAGGITIKAQSNGYYLEVNTNSDYELVAFASEQYAENWIIHPCDNSGAFPNRYGLEASSAIPGPHVSAVATTGALKANAAAQCAQTDPDTWSGFYLEPVINENIGNYLPLSGGVMSGNLDMGGHTITNIQKITSKDVEVAGTIEANEVHMGKWKTKTPDYVFDSVYELPSLDVIEKFVEKNGHLPEIPSAETMEKEGIDLATMNMLLLKKVEELTLYAIEQDRQIKDQKFRLEKLEVFGNK